MQFAEDANNTLWFSSGGGGGGRQVLAWFNTKMFDQTRDAVKSQGWTPYVIDTNGNGKRDAWLEPDQPVDPTKDQRIQGGSYGVIPNPVDGSIWVAAPGVPGAIIRVNTGPNPPMTALSEIYEPQLQSLALRRRQRHDEQGRAFSASPRPAHQVS